MKPESLKRGQRIQDELERVNHNLQELRDRETNPTARDIMWAGYGVSDQAAEKIRTIAINSLVSKRRSLQQEFKKL